MQLLQRDGGRLRLSLGDDRIHERLRAGHGRHTGDVMLQGGAADRLLVVMRRAPQGCVDDERDLALFDVVHDVRAALIDLKDCLDFKPDFTQARGRVDGRNQRETESGEAAREYDRLSFV